MIRKDDDEAERAADWRQNGNTPWYVKAVSIFGVPAAIALYLVYYMTNAMPTKAEVLVIEEQLKTHMTNTSTDIGEIKRVLMVSCVNAAKDAVQRTQCLGAPTGRDSR